MNHLTDEQLEDVMRNPGLEVSHLEQCSKCSRRLAEKKLVAGRLRSAFASVKPEEELAEKVRRGFGAGAESSSGVGSGHVLELFLHWRRLPAAAAAVVLLVLLGVMFYLPKAPIASAAQAELVKIHQHNLSSHNEFYSESDPAKLAEYFRGKLGFSPSMPRPGQGLALRGCCVRHFRGRVVGSYVVETPEGVMSIVVVTDRPESLGMGQPFEHEGQTFWKSSFAMCEMVTVRLGEYSYCAVGEVSHEYLTELLAQLVHE